MEHYYPKIHKVSLKSKCFGSEIYRRFYHKCHNCGKKNVRVPNYHLGVLENNQDEYYSGECPKCYRSVFWEPNYDYYDEMTSFGSHNMVVCGNYFKGYNRSKYAMRGIVSDEVFNNIINKCRKYDIPEPDRLLNKKEITNYIVGENI